MSLTLSGEEVIVSTISSDVTHLYLLSDYTGDEVYINGPGSDAFPAY